MKTSYQIVTTKTGETTVEYLVNEVYLEQLILLKHSHDDYWTKSIAKFVELPLAGLPTKAASTSN